MEEIFKEAHKFINDGEIDKAILIYEHIVKRMPDHVDARHDLARLLMETDANEQAIQVLDEGLVLDENASPFYFLKALLYLKLRNFSESMKAFRQVEKNDGLSSALVLNMGILHRELGSVSAGIELLENWQKGGCKEPQLYCLLAEMYIQVQDWNKSKILIRQGLSENPSEQNLLYLEATVLSRQKKWLDAIPKFKALLELQKDNLIIKHELGWAYLQVGHLEGGMELLKECHKAEPNKVHVIVDLALGFTQIPDYDQAMAYIRKAFELDETAEEVLQAKKEIEYGYEEFLKQKAAEAEKR